MFFQRCHRCLYQETLQTRRRGWAKPRMANDNRDLERNNEVGRNIDERGREQGEPKRASKGTGKVQEGAQQDGARMVGGMTANQFHSGQDQLRQRLLRLRHKGTLRRPGRGRTTPSWTWRTGRTSRRPGRGRTLPSWTWWTGGTLSPTGAGIKDR